MGWGGGGGEGGLAAVNFFFSERKDDATFLAVCILVHNDKNRHVSSYRRTNIHAREKTKTKTKTNKTERKYLASPIQKRELSSHKIHSKTKR